MKKNSSIGKMTAIAFLAVSLAACGSRGASESSYSEPAMAEYDSADYYEEAEYATEAAYDEDLYVDGDAIALAGRQTAPMSAKVAEAPAEGGEDYGAGNGMDATFTSGTGDDAGTPPAGRDPAEQNPPDSGGDTVRARKLITTVSIEAETEELDNILNRVQGEVTAMGGYIESSYISQDRTYMGNNNYSTRRRANLTLRVPEAKLESILATVSGETNVLEESRTTEDVTLTYVDIESRKKSLETQRESLMRLMEQAETVEDIITIEDRLSYVNYEIERMGSQLRSYDNLVDYATLHLTLREVVEYTPVIEAPDTFFTRISKGFSRNLKRVGSGIVDFLVWLISSLPQIIVIVAVVLIALRILRALRKRRLTRISARGEDNKKGKKRGLFSRRKKETVQTENAAPQEEGNAAPSEASGEMKDTTEGTEH